MHMRRAAAALAVLLVLGARGRAQTKTVAERLGYPPDAKLLIVHADDFAVAHSVDAASFDALDKNAVSSASVMVPRPWLNEVAGCAKDHASADLGLHLTLTSEWKTYRWGPVDSKDKVPSLLDSSGFLLARNGARCARSNPTRRSARSARKLNVPWRRESDTFGQSHGRAFREARSFRCVCEGRS